MDKLDKAIARLSAKEKIKIKELLKKIHESGLNGLNIKKLKGRNDIFRIRKGDIRIIFRNYNGKIYILAIERRSEKTYKKY